MGLFSKKETLIKSIPFMALMAAINVIISVLIALLPIASIFLVILLPLTSTLVAIYCKNRYFPIYAFATLGLSLAVTFWNLETTIFYVLPSAIIGFIFGLLIRLKIHPLWTIFISTVVQAGLTLASIPLINVLFDTDFVQFFVNLFKLDSVSWGTLVLLPTLLVFSFIQILLSYFVISEELKKFNEAPTKEFKHYWIFPLVGMALALSVIGFYFLSLSISYVLMTLSLYFATSVIYLNVINKEYPQLIIAATVLLMNIFLLAILYKSMKENSQLLLLAFTPLCINLVSLSFSLLHKKKD